MSTLQRSLSDVSLQCDNCESDIDKWHRTPQGRRYCPNCKTVRSEEQREAIHRRHGELP